MEGFKNIALLIDGENVTSRHLKRILESLASYGTISVRRIYADWTGGGMKSWKETLQADSLIPVQQFSYTQGKNSTDSAMIIDAMDLVHESLFDCFALVSSDSDFTRLAQRIREKGRYVIGFGEEKTPSSFRNACNDFVILRIREARLDDEVSQFSDVERLLIQGFELNSDDDGWCDMAALAQYMKKVKPDFSPSDLGKKKFADYFRERTKDFEVKKSNRSGPGPIYIRRTEHHSGE